MNCENFGKQGVFVSLIVILVTTPHWKMKPLFRALVQYSKRDSSRPAILIHKPANFSTIEFIAIRNERFCYWPMGLDDTFERHWKTKRNSLPISRKFVAKKILTR